MTLEELSQRHETIDKELWESTGEVCDFKELRVFLLHFSIRTKEMMLRNLQDRQQRELMEK